MAQQQVMMVYGMPLAGTPGAPSFSHDHMGFARFFEDVKSLADIYKQSPEETIKWALRYASPESESWKILPESTATPADWNNFVKAVAKLYPDLDEDKLYTKTQLHQLVESTQLAKTLNREDLGVYHRRFSVIAEFLVRKNRLSENDKRKLFLKGLPPSLRGTVRNLLNLKFPDDPLEQGYAVDAVKTITERLIEQEEQDAIDGTVSTPSRTNGSTNYAQSTQMNELIQIMTTFTQVMTANAQQQQASSQQYAPQQPPPPRQDQYAPQQPVPYHQDSYYPPPQRPAAPRYPPRTTPGGVASQPSQWGPRPTNYGRDQRCAFCSSPEHFIRECPVRDRYLREGKVVKLPNGTISFPGGASVNSRNLRGENIQERVDSFYERNGIPQQRESSYAANYLASSDETVYQIDISPVNDQLSQSSSRYDYGAHLAEEAQMQEVQAESLRASQSFNVQNPNQKKRVQFDGVQVPPKPGYLRGRQGPPAVPPLPYQQSHQSQQAQQRPPTILSRDRPPHVNQRPRSPPPPAPPVHGKPGARAGEQPVPRTQGPMKPTTYEPRPHAEEAKFRYQAPIEATVKSSDLFDRAMEASVTTSVRELFAIAPDVRRHAKDFCTSKKVSTNVLEEDHVESFLDSCFDAQEVPRPFVDFGRYDDSIPSAAASLNLRVIYPDFAGIIRPECVLDSGAQVVIMHKDVWEKLNVPLTESKSMEMESANSTITRTMGLVENFPVTFGPKTVKLQIQVVDKAPFEVLLGRPFFAAFGCDEYNTPEGSHELGIVNPNTGLKVKIPSSPRIRCAPHHNQQAGNFRR